MLPKETFPLEWFNAFRVSSDDKYFCTFFGKLSYFFGKLFSVHLFWETLFRQHLDFFRPKISNLYHKNVFQKGVSKKLSENGKSIKVVPKKYKSVPKK